MRPIVPRARPNGAISSPNVIGPCFLAITFSPSPFVRSLRSPFARGLRARPALGQQIPERLARLDQQPRAHLFRRILVLLARPHLARCAPKLAEVETKLLLRDFEFREQERCLHRVVLDHQTKHQDVAHEQVLLGGGALVAHGAVAVLGVLGGFVVGDVVGLRRHRHALVRKLQQHRHRQPLREGHLLQVLVLDPKRALVDGQEAVEVR
mmetsp:Transcript_3855/g.6598  ORF Transcript_3855/g.6598 Transcript_3855/m.6598 type:complete len:209 (+) Transcript_3855:383-1009(+)